VTPATTVGQVASDLVGLHSSDPTAVYLAARARIDDFAREDLEAALYDTRSLVRMLGMRRTMFVVPLDLAAIMNVACTRALAPPERRRLIRVLEEQGIAADGATWLTDVETRLVSALRTRGEATAVELTEDVPELRRKLRFGEGKTWGGEVGVSTRVLFLVATDGRIVRARPRGTWLSSQYRWVLTSDWIEGGLIEVPEEEAAPNLARRWLRTYGPGTFDDLKWWTGWTVAKTSSALAAVEPDEVDLEGAVGYVLPGATAAEPPVDPWVAMLPGLDPTVMGWKERDWYLGAHRARLFDRNGNAGPTVWADGRIVGGWAQRPDGEVAYQIFDDVGKEHTERIELEADRLGRWLGDHRVIPRFRTPLDKELST
jgi:hypothetical protein